MGYGCLQTTFCAFNGLIAVLAAACVGVGAWALASPESFLNKMAKALEEVPDLGISAKDIHAAAIVLVIIGAVIMLIAGIGCCGAAKNSKCLLGVFFIVMVIISVVVIVAVVLVQIYSPAEVDKALQEMVDKVNNSDEKAKASLDKFQELLGCCGVDGKSDFTGTAPPSCDKYTKGCKAVIEGLLSNTKGPVFITAIVTLVLLVLATLISGYLYCRGDGQAV